MKTTLNKRQVVGVLEAVCPKFGLTFHSPRKLPGRAVWRVYFMRAERNPKGSNSALYEIWRAWKAQPGQALYTALAKQGLAVVKTLGGCGSYSVELDVTHK